MYTYEQWKEVKAALSLTNKKIAEIIGKTEGNVKKQLSPNAKKLPTWANAMIYAYVEGLEKAIQANIEAFLTGDIKTNIHCAGAVKWPDDSKDQRDDCAVMEIAAPTLAEVLSRGMSSETETFIMYPCGCTHEDRFFKRAKGCKIARDEHDF